MPINPNINPIKLSHHEFNIPIDINDIIVNKHPRNKGSYKKPKLSSSKPACCGCCCRRPTPASPSTDDDEDDDENVDVNSTPKIKKQKKPKYAPNTTCAGSDQTDANNRIGNANPSQIIVSDVEIIVDQRKNVVISRNEPKKIDPAFWLLFPVFGRILTSPRILLPWNTDTPFASALLSTAVVDDNASPPLLVFPVLILVPSL